MLNDSREHVAWDIETTGFAWDDRITVTGFWFPQGFAVIILNTDGDGFDERACEGWLEPLTGGVDVSVYAVDDEKQLLERMQQAVFERFEQNRNRIIAFNAESWKAGFDLPFLRTRCIANQHDWVLDGLQFADLWEPVKKRLNTTATVSTSSVDINTLDGSHRLLTQSFDHECELFAEANTPAYACHDYDPFEDSAEAVTAHRHRNFRPAVAHNLADIHRTWELGELIRAYVPQKDITTKKL